MTLNNIIAQGLNNYSIDHIFLDNVVTMIQIS